MHSQETTKEIKSNTTDSNFKYRLTVIAEILDVGRAACEDEQTFQKQIRQWSADLACISTRRLMEFFIRIKRNRAACGVPFDWMPLRIDEMKIFQENL